MIKELINRLNVFRDLSILPGHFYSPVLMPQEIAGMEDMIFQKNIVLEGINLNEEGQLALLNEFEKYYFEINYPENKSPAYRYYFENKFFSYNSGIELYCFIRHFKPKNIIEVGSGFSSALMLDINEHVFKNGIKLSFIEPFPENRLLKLMKPNDHNQVKIYKEKVQNVPISLFSELNENDILFIDSSHVSKPGSDVNTLIFKVLPQLNPGVLIHFHDIFYPFEYPRNWVLNKGGFGWNEGYLLHAFLLNNKDYEIVFFNSYMEEKFKERFSERMPLCLKKQGGSIYIRKIR